MPGVILIDDEPAARRGLARMLQAHADVRILGESGSVAEARKLLESLGEIPDAVFLDVEMPQDGGFELIKNLAPSTSIIFVTAHSKHAALAFEVAALDYLLKPVRASRLAEAMDRLRLAGVKQNHPAPLPAPPQLSLRDHLCLNSSGRTLIAPVGQIVALLAEGDFTRFLIEAHSSVLMSYNLGRYESMLPQPPFVRLSRSLMINLSRVESLSSHSRDETLLKLSGINEPIELRRVAATRLKSLIQG